MKCKFWSQTMLAAAAVTVSAVTAIREPASATEASIDCQTINGVVTTVATNRQIGERKPLFYWHDDALRQSENARQKCEQVSGKLQAALATGGDDNLSIQRKEVGGAPVVCLKENSQAACGEILFTASNDRKMDRILGLQGARGVQKFGQPVTLWELLGLSRGQSQEQRSRNLVSPNQ